MPRDNDASQKVIKVFKNCALGLTDDELLRHMGESKPASVKTIRHRLFSTGQIYSDGTTRLNRRGRAQVVYKHQIFANSARKEKKDKKPVEISRSDKIRDAISGLLAIIQLIEIQLPKRKKK